MFVTVHQCNCEYITSYFLLLILCCFKRHTTHLILKKYNTLFNFSSFVAVIVRFITIFSVSVSITVCHSLSLSTSLSLSFGKNTFIHLSHTSTMSASFKGRLGCWNRNSCILPQIYLLLLFCWFTLFAALLFNVYLIYIIILSRVKLAWSLAGARRTTPLARPAPTYSTRYHWSFSF